MVFTAPWVGSLLWLWVFYFVTTPALGWAKGDELFTKSGYSLGDQRIGVSISRTWVWFV